LISADPVFIGGTAAFALTRQTVDVDTDGNGTPDLLGATLDAMALSVSNASVAVSGLVTLTVSGDLTLARVTAAGEATVRYTALKMGAVTVTPAVSAGSAFGLTGTLTIEALDYNSAAAGHSRLDWASGFDLDGDGTYGDLIDLGDQLTPVAAAGSLAIDLPGSLQFGLTGSVTGLSLTAGPVAITGDARFALTRQTVDVDTDGNG